MKTTKLRLINSVLFLVACLMFAYEQYGVSVLVAIALGYVTRMIDEVVWKSEEDNK